MKHIGVAWFVALLSFVAPVAAGAGGMAYDGAWSLSFVPQKGACGSTYEFNVNVSNGIVTHPNLVRFTGKVTVGGLVRASVAVQDKFAAGSGRLKRNSGRGTWTGWEASSRCSGYWIAQRL